MPGTSLGLPKRLQDASRTLQDNSSWPQDASSTLQDAPKTHPRRNSEAKTLPRHRQDPPELDFWRFWGAFGHVFLYPALTTFRKCETKFRSKVPLSKCRSHNVSKISSTDDGGLRVAVSITNAKLLLEGVVNMVLRDTHLKLGSSNRTQSSETK